MQSPTVFENTRTRNFALIACLGIFWASCLSGCSQPGASRLTGRWELVPPRQIEQEHSESPPSDTTSADNQDLFDSVAGGSTQGRMSLVFHASGSIETFTDFPMAQAQKSGRWTVVSYDPENNHCVVRFKIETEPMIEVPITFVGEDRILLIPPNIAVLEKQLLFQRNTSK